MPGTLDADDSSSTSSTLRCYRHIAGSSSVSLGRDLLLISNLRQITQRRKQVQLIQLACNSFHSSSVAATRLFKSVKSPKMIAFAGQLCWQAG